MQSVRSALECQFSVLCVRVCICKQNAHIYVVCEVVRSVCVCVYVCSSINDGCNHQYMCVCAWKTIDVQMERPVLTQSAQIAHSHIHTHRQTSLHPRTIDYSTRSAQFNMYIVCNGCALQRTKYECQSCVPHTLRMVEWM